MKRYKFFLLVLIMILFTTGCSLINRQGKPDEYYIEKYKEEAGLKNRKNLLCVVNTISNDQVKVTCNYEVGVNCLQYDSRAYTGACLLYDHYETRTVSEVYDIVYEED